MLGFGGQGRWSAASPPTAGPVERIQVEIGMTIEREGNGAKAPHSWVHRVDWPPKKKLVPVDLRVPTLDF